MDSLSIGESGSIFLGQEFGGNFANIVREQVRQYFKSFPGNDASGCNSHHSYFQSLVQGEIPDDEQLEYLSNILCYRMSMMTLATDLKDYLDLQIDDAHLFDTCTWENRVLEGCNRKEPDIEKAKEPWTRYTDIREAIMKAGVFESPAECQGRYYSKPAEYLAIAFYDSGRPKAQIINEIEKLVICKCPDLLLHQKFQI